MNEGRPRSYTINLCREDTAARWSARLDPADGQSDVPYPADFLAPRRGPRGPAGWWRVVMNYCCSFLPLFHFVRQRPRGAGAEQTRTRLSCGFFVWFLFVFVERNE